MVKNLIKTEVKGAVKKLFASARQIDFAVLPGDKFADYTSNIAMALIRQLAESDPQTTAEKIKAELEKSKNFNKYVSKTEVAGAGFLNFTLSELALGEEIKNLESLLNLGCNFNKDKKVLVEFVSANPTGELHIGHGRGAFFGDALANILEFSGAEVEREYFINDSRESVQIKELGKTVLGKGESYLTPKLAEKIKNLKIFREMEGGAGFDMARVIQRENQKFIEEDLKIKFNTWFSEEEELRQKGYFETALRKLEGKNLVYKKNGALWLKTSEYGDNEDRVIVRSDGTIPYFLSDISYHLHKFNRGYDKLINIWGADHHGHVKRIMAVKKMLGWKGEFDVLISHLVTLKEGRERKKLSKRAGTIVLLSDLVEELGLNVVRWFYLEKALGTHMEFDMELARKQSAKNPVYYVQYAHARIHSILEKSKIQPSNWRTKTETNSKSQISKLSKNPSARNLIIKLIQFPEIIEEIPNDYAVHKLTTYAYELAGEFSQFYRDVKVIGSGKDEEPRLALAGLTGRTLAKSLNLLGINAPNKM
jgi:arginyl-tRNA synthetase